MVEETFDYTSVLHLQLKDYFNNLLQTLQCDQETGEKKSESTLFFEEQEDILNLLIECDENNKENCFNYCEQFYFAKAESIYDIEFDQIAKFYEFVYDKMMQMKLQISEFPNLDMIRFLY